MMTTSTYTQEQLLGIIKNQANEIVFLKEQLEWFRRQIFGQRSEKTVSNLSQKQLEFALNCDAQNSPEEKQLVRACERKKPQRDGKDKISLPENIPVEKQVIDLKEEEKTCQQTGKPLVKIGEEVTRKLAYKPGSYFIKEIIRLKYALPENQGISTPNLPESLLTRCQADESFLADLLVKKFVDHLPLYRISEMLWREEINISRQILSQWVIRAGLALKPLYNAMTRNVLESQNLFIDETPINMLDPGKGKAHQAYMWVIVGGKTADPPYRIYNFRTNRQHTNAADLLKNYNGILHSDKYGAYEALANKKQFVWCPCWGVPQQAT